MQVIRSSQSLKAAINRFREEGKTIGFVPTMGALHAGHLALMALAQRHSDVVVASIFVNPTQFGPNEDLERYPRQEAEDCKALEQVGVAVAYLPEVGEMYPEGASATLSAGPVAAYLCGAQRPGHFDGVVTVVDRLFRQVQPDVAVFGEKDYQQLYLIREMAAAQGHKVKILGAPIVREADGLALSSRNAYLSPEERAIAPALHQTLQSVAYSIAETEETLADLLDYGRVSLEQKGFKVDYLTLLDGENLQPITSQSSHLRIFVAARLGHTRLIDNLRV